jgi:23S rRNA (uridine2552-2'-O)-methyltransferase
VSKKWLKEHKRDHYYKQAKTQGYRSRAAFKLQQINDKFKLIKSGMKVLDLGAAPGGWSQVALELVGEKGTVVGVDLEMVRPMEGGYVFIQGDMTKEKTREMIKQHFQECDVVISDMSPNITGNYSMDQARSIYLSTAALNVAKELLRHGGSFLVKVFEGEDFLEYLAQLKQNFNRVKRFSPPSSRSASSELYVICKGFKG